MHAEVSAGASLPEIKISGNIRTKTIYLQHLVKRCLEQKKAHEDKTRMDTGALRQCIMNSRLFAEVEVRTTTGQIAVEVEEKWTLIPVPALQAGSGKSESAGAYLFESNFLGMGMTAGLGGSVSNTGSSFLAFLSDPSFLFTHWQYSANVVRQNGDVVQYGHDTELDGFHEVASTFALAVGYQFHPWLLTPRITRQFKVFSAYGAYEIPRDNASTGLGLSLSYDTKNYKLYYAEGLGFQVNVNQEASRTDHVERYLSNSVQVNWQHAFFDDQALQLLLQGGVLYGGEKADRPRLGGGRGLRGIEARTLWAQRYLVTAMDYQPLLYLPITGGYISG